MNLNIQDHDELSNLYCVNLDCKVNPSMRGPWASLDICPVCGWDLVRLDLNDAMRLETALAQKESAE